MIQLKEYHHETAIARGLVAAIALSSAPPAERLQRLTAIAADALRAIDAVLAGADRAGIIDALKR